MNYSKDEMSLMYLTFDKSQDQLSHSLQFMVSSIFVPKVLFFDCLFFCSVRIWDFFDTKLPISSISFCSIQYLYIIVLRSECPSS